MKRWGAGLELLKVPGHFGFTMGVAFLLGLCHRQGWIAGLFVCASGVLSGLLCVTVKWVVGRTRPFKGVPPFSIRPVRGGPAGLFHEVNLSFPSGHTCLAFATGTAMGMLLPRFRVVFFLVAGGVAIERVLQSSHYASDVTAAIGLGVLATLITVRPARAIGLRLGTFRAVLGPGSSKPSAR